MKRDVDLLSDELVPFVDDAPRRDADGDDATAWKKRRRVVEMNHMQPIAKNWLTP